MKTSNFDGVKSTAEVTTKSSTPMLRNQDFDGLLEER